MCKFLDVFRNRYFTIFLFSIHYNVLIRSLFTFCCFLNYSVRQKHKYSRLFIFYVSYKCAPLYFFVWKKEMSYFSMSFLPLSLCNGIKLSEKYQNTEKKANRNYDVFISNVMNSSLAYMLRLLFKLYSLLALFEKHFSYETLCAYCSPEIR